MKLVYEATGKEVQINDKVTLEPDGVRAVHSIEKPKHGGSTGRVYLRKPGTSLYRGYYPSVIGAKWIDRDDQP